MLSRAGLVLGVAAVVAVLGGPAVASGACPCLVLHLPDGTIRTVVASDVGEQADVHDVQYFLRAVPGGSRQDEPYVGTGLSVRHALESLSPALDPSTVGFTQVTRPDGSWSTLTTSDLGSPSDFDSGLLPVVRVDGDVLEYVRPLRPGTQDVNAKDLLRSSSLDLYVHTGALLTVTSRANPGTARPGQPVVLSAQASGGPGPFVFTWVFGDGSTATGASVEHSYAQSGSYLVSVTVAGPNDSGGSADPLVVNVASSSVPSPRPTSTGPQGSAPARPASSPSAAPRPQASGRPAAAAPPAAPQKTASRPPVVRSAASITGVLITAAPPAPSSPVEASRSSATADGSGLPLEAAGAGFTAVVLLSLGAARELRRPLLRGTR